MTDRRIIHLPGTELTPQVVLHQTLELIANIKAVTIVIQWEDDTFELDWSRQQTNDFCMAAMLLHATATRLAQGDDSV